MRVLPNGGWAFDFLASPAFADHKTLITLTISDSSSGGGGDSGTYIIVIPESLAPTSSGWTAFTGGISIKTAEGSTFSADKKLVISADSENEWKLVLSPDKSASIGYTLNTSSADKTATTTFEYSAASIDVGVSQDLGVIIADYTGRSAGTYEDTITFHVEVQDAEEAGNVVDLSTVTVYEAQTGDILTGTAGSEAHITVAAGATITLKDATITSIPSNDDHQWAGITPLGDATITLKGTNEIKGGHEDYPGIFADEGYTLTIKGNGSLIASSNGYGAGIGGGYEGACGNIVIEGGTITAAGGEAAGIGSGIRGSCGNITINGGTITATGGDTANAPGIGSSNEASCGNITISGGNITSTGGYGAAGIGSGGEASCETIIISGGTITATGGYTAAGIGSGANASCGTITITSGVTSVTANKGDDAPNSIGAGYGDDASCDGVNIDSNANVTQN